MRINGRIAVKTETDTTIAGLKAAFALARANKPAYSELYPFLEALFTLQAQAGSSLELLPVNLSSELAQAKWGEGFPLLQRWDFPLDGKAAATILALVEPHLPASNQELSKSHAALKQSLARHPEHAAALWRSFLQHDWEPWEEWVQTEGLDLPPLLYLARSCLRPSLARVAKDLIGRFPLPDSWLKGYCPVCGSLPSLLLLQGDGERKAYCSWCGTLWGLHRLQCPYCDNRYHESLGYLFAEGEEHYRAHYCRLCKHYFKQIDLRERLDPPCLPLEEWTTLHLDLLAQQAGWLQPPSPSPVVYGEETP
jgi:FdhE protein